MKFKKVFKKYKDNVITTISYKDSKGYFTETNRIKEFYNNFKNRLVATYTYFPKEEMLYISFEED